MTTTPDKPPVPDSPFADWPRITIDTDRLSPFGRLLRTASHAASRWTLGPEGPYARSMTPSEADDGHLREGLLHLLELGLLDIDTERLDAARGLPCQRNTGPAAAARPDDTARIVAYRSNGGRLLRCLAHAPELPDRDFRPVTAEGLPDGGICTHPDCGIGILAHRPDDTRTETGPTEPPTPRCAHCRHPKRDHSDRRDHKPHPTLPRDPWCHACDAPCDYAGTAA